MSLSLHTYTHTYMPIQKEKKNQKELHQSVDSLSLSSRIIRLQVIFFQLFIFCSILRILCNKLVLLLISEILILRFCYSCTFL